MKEAAKYVIGKGCQVGWGAGVPGMGMALAAYTQPQGLKL